MRACPASARARTNVVVVSSAASTCTSPWRDHPLCGCTRALALLVSKSGNWFQSARRKQAEMHYAPLPASLRGVVQRVYAVRFVTNEWNAHMPQAAAAFDEEEFHRDEEAREILGNPPLPRVHPDTLRESLRACCA